MKKITLFSCLVLLALSACTKKDKDKPADYSQPLWEPGSDWERVGVIPWQGEIGDGRRLFEAYDLRVTPGGEVAVVYMQVRRPLTSNIEAHIYKTVFRPGDALSGTVTELPFLQVSNDDRFLPLLIPGTTTARAYFKSIDGDYKQGLADESGQAGEMLSTNGAVTFFDLPYYRSTGERMRPRLQADGDLISGQANAALQVSRVDWYHAAGKSWTVQGPAQTEKPDDAFPFRVGTGQAMVCQLYHHGDSLFAALYQSNTGTGGLLEPFLVRYLPEFSGSGQSALNRLVAYNDEEGGLGFVVGASPDGKDVTEVSGYHWAPGETEIRQVYGATGIPGGQAALSDWGYGLRYAYSGTCTPEGWLYTFNSAGNNTAGLYYIDGSGIHLRGSITASPDNPGASIAQLPLRYYHGSFYLIATPGDDESGSKNYRLEVYRMK